MSERKLSDTSRVGRTRSKSLTPEKRKLSGVISTMNAMELDEATNQRTATTQSPFMARQAERRHMTGLSPIEEMRLAQHELRAQAATNIGVNRIGNVHPIVTAKDVLRKLKESRAASQNKAPEETVLEQLTYNVDDLTPAQALSFVETVSKDANIIRKVMIKREESRIPFFIISPHGKFRLRWDIILVTLIFYNAVVIPFQTAFDDSEQSISTTIVQRAVDAFFITDILVNFLSAYEKNGRIEKDPRRIAKHYFTTWLAFDLLSSVPTVAIPESYSRVPRLARLVRLFRLLRLFRMVTILRILNRLEYALLLRSTVSSLFKFCLLVCFTSHWLSCAFYRISVGNPNGWVANEGVGDKSLYVRYVTAFYWSIMTMTTVGYGDVHAATTQERIFAIFAMVLGAGIFAYGITNVVAMVSHLNENDAVFQLKMDELNDYMEARELPIHLRYEIREFFFNARLSTETKLANEANILGELSALLRSKIAFAINDSVLNKMPFFVGADHNFLMELALSMRMVCFPPNEEIILEGEVGEEMFFIFRGVVEVLKGGSQMCLLTEKQYFGEMAILSQNCLRTATVRTLTFSELRMLTREKFLIALTHFPTMKARIAKIVKERARQNIMATAKDVLATMAASMDEKMAQEITAPVPETTLGRISRLTVQHSNNTLPSSAVETDFEHIRAKVNDLMQKQDELVLVITKMEEKLGALKHKMARIS